MSAKIAVSPQELAQGAYTPESLEQALARFHESGYLELENAFEPGFIQELQQAYLADHGHMRPEQLEASSLKVGEGRYMVSVELKKPFNTPRLYANPMLTALLERLLGPGFLINSFTCVVAYPGAKDQRLHSDYPPIFRTPELNAHLETYAITVSIPLVDLDPQIGTTAMLPGTHKLVIGDPQAKDASRQQLPFPRVGGCYFMDYRLFHYGTANTSDRLRPILYLVYSRPWFVDAENFGKQPPVKIRPHNLAQIPPEHLGLFKRVLQNTAYTMSLL